MVKTHEYLGTKATAWAPYGYRKEIALYVKEKKKESFLVERHNEYFNRSKESWKNIGELKKAIRQLDTITEKGLSYIGLDVEHCPSGFRKSTGVAVKSCVRESADLLYEFKR